MSALRQIFRPRRGGAPVHRTSIVNRLKQSFDLNVLSTFQRMLLAFAVLGLLFAHVGGIAHETMNDRASVATADHAPCCPHHQADDCAKCALGASCVVHCINNFAPEVVSIVAIGGASESIATPSRTNRSGINHPPLLKPPRAEGATRADSRLTAVSKI